MPDIPPHDELLELAYPYALDALPAADRHTVEDMLTRADDVTAATFRATVRDLRETLADLAAVNAVPAPPNVEAALLRAIDGQSPPRANPARRRRLFAAAAAVVVAAAIAVGITLTDNQSPTPSGPSAQQVRTHSDTRSETIDVRGGGTMTVALSRELDAATVAFDAVPTLPTGRTYQMWLIDHGGQAHSVGLLHTLPDANAPMLVRIDDAGQVAMSIEPDGGSPAPTNARATAPLR